MDDLATDDGGDDVEAAARVVDQHEVAPAAGVEDAATGVTDQSGRGGGRAGGRLGQRAAGGPHEDGQTGRQVGRGTRQRPVGKADGAVLTITSWTPRRIRPSGRPSAAVVSETARNRAGPSARQYAASVVACRWWPSAITPATRSGPARATPTGPGARCRNGRMAFPRWVNVVAPASTASRTSAAVASVCPMHTHTPRAVSWRTTSVAPASSGARVTMSTPASRDQPLDELLRRRRHQVRGWAPTRAGAIIGPSKCRPSGMAPTQPGGGPAASVARAAMRVTSSAVMTVGANAVTPYAGSAAATSHSRSGSAVMSTPTAPLTWRSMRPGSTRSPVASMTRSAPPGPEPAITTPSTMVTSSACPTASVPPRICSDIMGRLLPCGSAARLRRRPRGGRRGRGAADRPGRGTPGTASSRPVGAATRTPPRVAARRAG